MAWDHYYTVLLLPLLVTVHVAKESRAALATLIVFGSSMIFDGLSHEVHRLGGALAAGLALWFFLLYFLRHMGEPAACAT